MSDKGKLKLIIDLIIAVAYTATLLLIVYSGMNEKKGFNGYILTPAVLVIKYVENKYIFKGIDDSEDKNFNRIMNFIINTIALFALIVLVVWAFFPNILFMLAK